MEFDGTITKRWVSSLRIVYEAIYYLLLVAYKGLLETYLEMSLRVATEAGQTKKRTPLWVSSIALEGWVQSAAMHGAAVAQGVGILEVKRWASDTLQMSYALRGNGKIQD